MKTPALPGFTLWFTGLPCSGKTSLSEVIAKELSSLRPSVEPLDGDVIRRGISRDLGFSKEDRAMNLERVAFLASLLTRNGVAVLVSFVSPYRQMRDDARSKISPFIEVYVSCSLEECERRDIKGMYKLARQGQIKDFTGVSDTYEEPLHPEIIVETDRQDIQACANKILQYLESRSFITRNPFPEHAFLTKVYALALEHHFGQTRKGNLPYITHPIAVARMLQEAGYGDDIVAAGLLHDVLEDTGCELEEMKKVAGPRATDIVVGVTDKDKTVPWSDRKENYLKMLESGSDESLVVSCGDKIHNIESLIEGYRAAGDAFSKKFSGGFAAKIDNYEKIYRTIARRSPGCRLLSRYKSSLDELAGLGASTTPSV